jgi:D-serine deaminase-like pyridoxal phosphate-dependent protein
MVARNAETHALSASVANQDVLPIIPNHVCPVVNNFGALVVTDAAGTLLERWAVAARGT